MSTNWVTKEFSTQSDHRFRQCLRGNAIAITVTWHTSLYSNGRRHNTPQGSESHEYKYQRRLKVRRLEFIETVLSHMHMLCVCRFQASRRLGAAMIPRFQNRSFINGLQFKDHPTTVCVYVLNARDRNGCWLNTPQQAFQSSFFQPITCRVRFSNGSVSTPPLPPLVGLA